MFRRRRPLMRAAVVGGGAYMAGKHVANRQAEDAQMEADQDERIGQLEQQQQGHLTVLVDEARHRPDRRAHRQIVASTKRRTDA